MGIYADTTCENWENWETCENWENYIMTEESLRKLDEIHEHRDVMSTLRDIAVLEHGLRLDCNEAVKVMRETGTVSPEQVAGVIRELQRLDGVIRKSVEALVGQPVDWDNGKE